MNGPPATKAPASVVGRKDSNLRMVEAISGRMAPHRRASATSLGSAIITDADLGAISILRTNATNWPDDVAPSPAVQLTSLAVINSDALLAYERPLCARSGGLPRVPIFTVRQ